MGNRANREEMKRRIAEIELLLFENRTDNYGDFFRILRKKVAWAEGKSDSMLYHYVFLVRTGNKDVLEREDVI